MRYPAEAMWDPHDVQQPQLADRYTVIWPGRTTGDGHLTIPFQITMRLNRLTR